MKQPTLIDPHVHLRDWSQAYKETLEHGLDVAWRCGLSAVFEMPNTDPPLTRRPAIERRIAAADEARAIVSKRYGAAPFHALYAGITAESAQIAEVIRAYQELFPRVVGLKLFAGHSTGRMGVVTTREQRVVWRSLARLGYRGVVAVHAEREDLTRDASDHADARPPIAEIASVQTQLVLAEEAGFRGTLHVVHVSVPETVELVRGERGGLPFAVTMGVTPHHVLLDAATAPRINPPVRRAPAPQRLFEQLVAGEVDWVESDHAPHDSVSLANGAAGAPGMPAFRTLRERLRLVSAPSLCPTEALFGERVRQVFKLDDRRIPANPNAEHTFGAADYTAIASEYALDPYLTD